MDAIVIGSALHSAPSDIVLVSLNELSQTAACSTARSRVNALDTGGSLLLHTDSPLGPKAEESDGCLGCL